MKHIYSKIFYLFKLIAFSMNIFLAAYPIYVDDKWAFCSNMDSTKMETENLIAAAYIKH